MNELELYGPPGTGKTTQLTRIALQTVQEIGPARLGAVTYTRAAATELKARLASALGIRVPESPSAARRVLDQAMPWVGTVHSLAWKLVGRPKLLSTVNLTDFTRAIDPTHRAIPMLTDPEAVEGYEFGDVGSRDEVELALQLRAMARHRLVSIADAMRYLSDRSRVEVSVPRMEYIAEQYERFKNDIGRIDFEDMLSLGGEAHLPVSVLLCDEVQDNSALLWQVIDAWAGGGVGLSVMAGDPWQAIYQFSGASPDLFRKRQGRWITIGDSHRLSARSADYALRLLRQAGYEDDSLLSTWKGVGQPDQLAGTKFYLARTNRMLDSVRQRLEEEGTPYRLLRGSSPLQTRAAQAFRLVRKCDGEITVAAAAAVADCLPAKAGVLPRGLAAAWSRLADQSPETLIGSIDLAAFDAAFVRLPHLGYFDRIVAKHGISGMALTPATSIGTIHAAKGREADEVNLVRSWGWLPARRLYEGGKREEGCVAYVAATRHRRELNLIDGEPGIDYPFPPQALD